MSIPTPKAAVQSRTQTLACGSMKLNASKMGVFVVSVWSAWYARTIWSALTTARQWRSEGGGAGGGHLPPGAAQRGGRQNHAKEFFKIYILRNFEKSERIQ